MPMDFCTSLGARMPVADCSVERGTSAALRRSDSVRVPQAASVTASAQGPLTRSRAGSPASAASALARIRPEDSPISAKLTSVSGCAHSWMKRRQA